MNGPLKQQILNMWNVASATPTAQHAESIIDGWDRYFRTAGLTEAQQVVEFDEIIRLRRQAGSQSLVAPTRLVE